MLANCSRMLLVASLLMYAEAASADFWKDINPFRQITPNWGPLVPKPQGPGEVLPPCWGQPQNCRDMQGDPPASSPQVPNIVLSSEQAACVCLEANGSVIAYFLYRPTDYGMQRRLQLSSSGCDSFIQCNYQYYTQYDAVVRATGWSFRTSLVNGNTIYVMSGSQ